MLGIVAGLALGSGALAQGQDSSTSAQAPNHSKHPPPLLSTDSVTSVASGDIVHGEPLAQDMRPRRPGPLGWAGPVTIPEVRLACDAIRDETARSRCQARSGPAAGPEGSSE